MSGHAARAYLATSPEECARLGLKRDLIEPWEDGFRTDGARGTYEWWYFDVHLSDGAKLVIVFYTKPIVDVGKPLTPNVAFTLDRADGTRVEKSFFAPPAGFSASRKRCDVRIGSNVFAGDLRTFHIHVEIEEVLADIVLHGTARPWRPASGHLLFGARGQHYFAWLPSVPQGEVEAAITIAGRRSDLTGIGYHDHNWGNIALPKLVNHWYWARGKIGDYTLIASHITAEKRYGYRDFPVFMLARDGRILADDGERVQFTASDIAMDRETARPVAGVTRYEYRDGDVGYRLTLRRRKTILRMKLVETIGGVRGLLARLVGFDGAFLRFTGDAVLERYEGERIVETQQDEAIWELMYLGHVRKG